MGRDGSIEPFFIFFVEKDFYWAGDDCKDMLISTGVHDTTWLCGGWVLLEIFLGMVIV